MRPVRRAAVRADLLVRRYRVATAAQRYRKPILAQLRSKLAALWSKSEPRIIWRTDLLQPAVLAAAAVSILCLVKVTPSRSTRRVTVEIQTIPSNSRLSSVAAGLTPETPHQRIGAPAPAALHDLLK